MQLFELKWNTYNITYYLFNLMSLKWNVEMHYGDGHEITFHLVYDNLFYHNFLSPN